MRTLPLNASNQTGFNMDAMQLGTSFEDFEKFHSNASLRGTPFFKPLGRYYDLDLTSSDVEHPSSQSLYLGRLLLSCYDNEFIYVLDPPDQVDSGFWDENYSADKVFQSHIIRYRWERPYFQHLQREVQVTGEWSLDSFQDYFGHYLANLDAADSRAVIAKITDSPSPVHAARLNAAQFSAEFLVEASGMTRNLQGYYGPEQAEYFKIVTDEYGYGVHSTKHSTLYRAFLESIGLYGRPHQYWWFYLSSTLLSNNYINFSCNNHINFFKYLGSLTQSENGFAASLSLFDDLYTQLFPESNTAYFREHVHIDQHHGRMAFKDLCLSIIRRGGPQLIPSIVRGFEESMYLGRMYREDLSRQLDWLNSVWSTIELSENEELLGDTSFFTTMVGKPAVLTAESGIVRVAITPWAYRTVRPGESFEIPSRVLFGLAPDTGSSYRITLG